MIKGALVCLLVKWILDGGSTENIYGYAWCFSSISSTLCLALIISTTAAAIFNYSQFFVMNALKAFNGKYALH
jgi:hypothetical protein